MSKVTRIDRFLQGLEFVQCENLIDALLAASMNKVGVWEAKQTLEVDYIEVRPGSWTVFYKPLGRQGDLVMGVKLVESKKEQGVPVLYLNQWRSLNLDGQELNMLRYPIPHVPYGVIRLAKESVPVDTTVEPLEVVFHLALLPHQWSVSMKESKLAIGKRFWASESQFWQRRSFPDNKLPKLCKQVNLEDTDDPLCRTFAVPIKEGEGSLTVPFVGFGDHVVIQNILCLYQVQYEGERCTSSVSWGGQGFPTETVSTEHPLPTFMAPYSETTITLKVKQESKEENPEESSVAKEANPEEASDTKEEILKGPGPQHVLVRIEYQSIPSELVGVLRKQSFTLLDGSIQVSEGKVTKAGWMDVFLGAWSNNLSLNLDNQ